MKISRRQHRRISLPSRRVGSSSSHISLLTQRLKHGISRLFLSRTRSLPLPPSSSHASTTDGTKICERLELRPVRPENRETTGRQQKAQKIARTSHGQRFGRTGRSISFRKMRRWCANFTPLPKSEGKFSFIGRMSRFYDENE